MPHPQIAALLRSLDQAFDHKAWHGPNLCGSLRGLTARQAAWRPAPGRHNIWEIAVHAAYWKYAVRRRLTGEKRGSFALEGSNWFARPTSVGEKQWRADLALLEYEHRLLRAAIKALPHRKLRRPPAGTPWSALDTILGVALHDVYHAGQIRLLKRLQKARTR
ncbi:MAG: DinB family protein [Acidobacteria bacterium]|nr:DinB family protein [Acidobacteriota bacterium]